ncbi:hypothetical protein C0J52_02836 [Blattella germanica]|nr:hypothetical protein C0J52_02836 [Blattella germanica]
MKICRLRTLQAKYMDIEFCAKEVMEAGKLLTEMRNSFQNIYDRTVMVAGPPEAQRKRRLHGEIFDNIVVQINTRFENIGKLKFLELLDFSKFLKYEQEFPISAFKSLQENYGGYFDTASLRSELNSFAEKVTHQHIKRHLWSYNQRYIFLTPSTFLVRQRRHSAPDAKLRSKYTVSQKMNPVLHLPLYGLPAAPPMDEIMKKLTIEIS